MSKAEKDTLVAKIRDCLTVGMTRAQIDRDLGKRERFTQDFIRRNASMFEKELELRHGLTPQSVEEMKWRVQAGMVTKARLARDLDIPYSTFCRILRG